MHDPNPGYRPPSAKRARINLVAGLVVGGVSFFAAYVANESFRAVERGEAAGVLMTSPLVDLYELVGRGWTVAALATFGALMLVVGLVSWWRERR